MLSQRTKVINLWGAPGSGKSMLSAGLFYHMKLNGYSVELITEYAKSLTWAERNYELACQPYIMGKQFNKIFTLLDKVDYIISDSPLPLGIIYNNMNAVIPSFGKCCIELYDSHKHIDFYLNTLGVAGYEQEGRSQTEEEAIDIDRRIRQLIDEWEINPLTIDVIDSDEKRDYAIKYIMNAINIMAAEDLGDPF